MKLHLPSFNDARVLVAGDVLLDRYWHGATSRISPEAPVPVVHVRSEEERAGGAGNVALNLRALGAPTALLGLAGRDSDADRLQALLDDAGVEGRLIRSPEMPTITKLRVISRHQQLIRLDFEDGYPDAMAAELADAFEAALLKARVVVLSDYSKGALRYAPRMIEVARRAAVPVLVDPKGQDFTRYRGATLITPNLSEFEAVAGRCASLDDLVERGMSLIDELALEGLLVTRGEDGLSLLRRGEAPLHMPARAREVYDVTGAGDTVIAVFAATLAAGGDRPSAAALANVAAGIVVGKLGTATASPHELRRALHESEEGGYGIMDRRTIGQAVSDAKAHGERIVFTNGCFDILHAGHVAYLNEIRRLGDRLVVAVNDDDSVRRLKGAGRPINRLEDRMSVLAGLSAVDWVVPFSEDTPRDLIAELTPDVLAKGGDYRPEDIAGAAEVEAAGGRVVVVDYREGKSTSALLTRIRGQAEGAGQQQEPEE